MKYEVILPEGMNYEYGEVVPEERLLESAKANALGSIHSTGWRPFKDSAFLGEDGKLYQIAVKVEFVPMSKEDTDRLGAEYCLHTREHTCKNCLVEDE